MAGLQRADLIIEVNGNRFGDDRCKWWEDRANVSEDEDNIDSSDERQPGDESGDCEGDEEEDGEEDSGSMFWEGDGIVAGSTTPEADLIAGMEQRERVRSLRRPSRTRLQLVSGRW